MLRSTIISNVLDMQAFGRQIAAQLKPGMVVFLNGDLGAGKTTIVQGILQGFGYRGVVKSPTYTLVESYTIDELEIHHCDFYRLKNASELDAMGLADYCTCDAILLIEWPELVKKRLPAPQLEIVIEEASEGRMVTCRTPDSANEKK